MTKEITLMAGTEFVKTADVPERIARALHPVVLDETRQVTQLLKKAKPCATDATAKWNGWPVEEDDCKILNGFWTGLPALELPITEEAWRPYAEAFKQKGHHLDWELDAQFNSPSLVADVLRFAAERKHQSALVSAIRHGQLNVLSPLTRLPTDENQSDSIVTVEEFSRYVERLRIKVRYGTVRDGGIEQPAYAAKAEDKSNTSVSLEVFHSMEKLIFDDVSIAFVGDKPELNSDIGANNFLEISAQGMTRRVALAALDLVKKQAGGLNGEGVILLGMTKGKVLPDTSANQAKMKRLRKVLKKHLGIKSDPFYPKHVSGKWEAKFKIEDKRGAADKRAKRDAECYKTESFEQRNERGEKAVDTNQTQESHEDDYSFADENDAAAEYLKNNNS